MIKVMNVASLYQAMYGTIDYCKNHIGENIEIIVPDKLSLFMEKFFFEKMNIECSFDVKVSTLNRFSKKNLSIDPSMTISKTGSILLIHKIMNDNIDKLSVLKSKAYSFTYAENIFRTIAQLKASKITAQEMLDFRSSDAQLNDKIQDLALVYSEYENSKAGMLDSSDLFLMSTLTVAKGKENTKLLFVGFDDFTAIEYSIIERLSIASEVVIYNYFTKNNNKHIYNREVVEQLKNIAFINKLPFEMEDMISIADEFRNEFESNIYGIKQQTILCPVDKVSLFSGNNITEEIEHITRDIRKKILLGYRYSDFGVAIYGLENNIGKIKEILEKYEINYYIDSEISLNKSIFYKFLLSVFKYNFNSYNLCHLIDIINSPFFDLDRLAKDKLILRLIDVNFYGKITDRTNLGSDFEDILNRLRMFLSYFDLDKNMKTSEYIKKIKLANENLRFNERLEVLASTNDLQNKIILIKSYKIIFELFDEISKFNSELSISQFMDMYEHVATVVKINNLPLTIDAIKIVDADNTMEIFNNLYIVNMTAENAPSLKYDCGIILDSEIDKLNFSHKLSPAIAHINKLARLRVYNLLSLFEEGLTIAYSGNPSEVVVDMMKKIIVEVDNNKFSLTPNMMLGFGNYEALSEWDYIERICKNNQKNNFISEKIVKNKEFVIKNKDNLQKIKNITTISASRLEEYFACPFKMFLDSNLKIRPRIKSEMQAFDIGNILHNLLYNYYKCDKQVDDLYEFVKSQVYNEIDKDERLKLSADKLLIKNLIDEAMRTIYAMNYIDENSLFKVDKNYLEYDFSKSPLVLSNIKIIGKIDRVDISPNDSGMLRIVDYKTGKTNPTLKELYYGQKLQLFLYSSAMEKIENSKRVVGCFYLPLHNDYTREIGNSYSLNGFYINEENIITKFDKRLLPGVKSDIVNVNMTSAGLARQTIGYKELTSQSMGQLKAYAKKITENAVDEIKSGYIMPNPSGISKPCDYCPYMQVCLKRSIGVDYRSEDSVSLESFKEV